SLISDWKEMEPDARRRLLEEDRPWRFAAWVDEHAGADRRAFRHMILYLLFPENFERSCSNRHKRAIAQAFLLKLPSGSAIDTVAAPMLKIDQVILQIRKVLQNEHGTEELDFYREPLRQMWHEPAPAEEASLADEKNDDRPNPAAATTGDKRR